MRTHCCCTELHPSGLITSAIPYKICGVGRLLPAALGVAQLKSVSAVPGIAYTWYMVPGNKDRFQPGASYSCRSRLQVHIYIIVLYVCKYVYKLA